MKTITVNSIDSTVLGTDYSLSGAMLSSAETIIGSVPGTDDQEFYQIDETGKNYVVVSRMGLVLDNSPEGGHFESLEQIRIELGLAEGRYNVYVARNSNNTVWSVCMVEKTPIGLQIVDRYNLFQDPKDDQLLLNLIRRDYGDIERKTDWTLNESKSRMTAIVKDQINLWRREVACAC